MSGIYIHIPFCKKACDYCNFHFSVSQRYKDDVLQAICTELEERKHEMTTPLESLYFGGGTPSILSVHEIEQIINTVHQHYNLPPNAEICLEANPDDLQGTRCKELFNAGINRFSMGIQSFHKDDLAFLGRVHSVRETHKAIENALNAGFKNLSIDLIFGIPGSNEAKWRKNLEHVAAYKLPHISAYALTVEPKTIYDYRIRKQQKANVDDDLVCDQYEQLVDFAQNNNFEHYEISNYAKPGFRAIHNSNYWKNKPYLGIGPGAHSYNGNKRRWNVAHNKQYAQGVLSKQPIFEEEVLSQTDHFNEYVMISLRTMEGLNLKQLNSYQVRYDHQKWMNKIAHFIAMDWMIQNKDQLVLSNEGILLSDHIISELFI